jgi:hypothetical protein
MASEKLPVAVVETYLRTEMLLRGIPFFTLTSQADQATTELAKCSRC